MTRRRFPPRLGGRRIASRFEPQAAAAFGRKRWRDLIGQARLAVDLGRRGVLPTTLFQAQIRTALQRTGAAPLPVEAEQASAAEQARTAFAAAVEDLLRAVTPEQRIERAAALSAACDAVEHPLDLAAQAEARRTWQRQFPGED